MGVRIGFGLFTNPVGSGCMWVVCLGLDCGGVGGVGGVCGVDQSLGGWGGDMSV